MFSGVVEMGRVVKLLNRVCSSMRWLLLVMNVVMVVRLRKWLSSMLFLVCVGLSRDVKFRFICIDIILLVLLMVENMSCM